MPIPNRMAQPAAAPLRHVRLGALDAVLDRRADGSIIVRSSQDLGRYHATLSEPLGHWAKAAPDRVFLAQRDAQRQLAQADLRAGVRPGEAHRRRAAAARAVARQADRDPVRQRHRACAAGLGGDACRHSLCAGVAGLFADVERLRQAAHDHRIADARHGVCRRRRRFRQGDRRLRAGDVRTGGDAKSAGRPQDDLVRRSDRRRRRRPPSPPRRPR